MLLEDVNLSMLMVVQVTQIPNSMLLFTNKEKQGKELFWLEWEGIHSLW